ncbi:hypothetical protein EU524_01020 [Candidatus Thorarchaeota archaeon]|nr:MAG: hypothetical protein EU524_01020 [Candidatus Thorarchaeota archaeon]
MTRFVVDAMLGRVALWLRLTGNDAYYTTDADDEDLLTLAEEDNRVLLTSDGNLHRRALKQDLNSHLLRGAVDDKVAEVFRTYAIEPRVDPSTARCSKCNGTLRELRGEERSIIKDKVYPQTYDHYDVFWLCEECGSVYFQGGYWKNVVRYMERIEQLMNEEDA